MILSACASDINEPLRPVASDQQSSLSASSTSSDAVDNRSSVTDGTSEHFLLEVFLVGGFLYLLLRLAVVLK